MASPISLIHQLPQLDGERLRHYREHLDFYNGSQWTRRAKQGERQLTLNYAKVFVEKVTSYLMSGLSYAVDPSTGSGRGSIGGSRAARDRARRAEDALREIGDANQTQLLDFDTEIDTAILGDGCYKVVWSAAERRVRISAPDVQGIYAWWVGDDLARVWRVASRYRLSADEVQFLYGFRPTGKLTDVVEVWTADRFELWLDGVLHDDRPNPHGFIPFVIFPNLREPKQFWGTSDLLSLKEPARELNRSLSTLSSILELSGNPVAVLENVDKADDIAVAPGAVWELPERARAYLLDLLAGGGVRLHIEYIQMLYRILHDLSETPRTSFGDNPQALSGVALEMELHPLLQKVRRKRQIRTAAYQRRNEMVLRILEQKTGVSYRPYRTQVLWGPILPQDHSRLITDEESLVRAGLHSRRRAMRLLGVEDPDAELRDIAGESSRMLREAQTDS
jgi:hypothetical protein